MKTLKWGYRLPDVKIYLSQWINIVGIKYASLRKRGSMKAEEVLKKVKEYLEDNKEDASLDIQSDSKHLLFWIENWEAEWWE